MNATSGMPALRREVDLRHERGLVDDRHGDPVGLVRDRRPERLDGLLHVTARRARPLHRALHERGRVLGAELRGDEQRVERVVADEHELPARVRREVAAAVAGERRRRPEQLREREARRSGTGAAEEVRTIGHAAVLQEDPPDDAVALGHQPEGVLEPVGREAAARRPGRGRRARRRAARRPATRRPSCTRRCRSATGRAGRTCRPGSTAAVLRRRSRARRDGRPSRGSRVASSIAGTAPAVSTTRSSSPSWAAEPPETSTVSLAPSRRARSSSASRTP